MARHGRRGNAQPASGNAGRSQDRKSAYGNANGFGDGGFGRKRKAGPSREAYGRPGKARKVEKSQQPILEYGEATLLRTLKFPTKDEIAGLPNDIMKSTKVLLHNALQASAKIKEQFIQARGIWSCTAAVEFAGIPKVEALGEGLDKKSSEKAAFLHLLAKLHEQDILSQIWPAEEKINNNTMREEKDAKLDVYIYAAKYGLVPQFSHRTVSILRRGGYKMHEVTISLPEQEIEVTGRSKNEHMAEVSASMKFKQEAEKLLIKRNDELPGVKDDALSVGTAKSFFQWYKQEFPSARTEVEVKTVLYDRNQATFSFQGAQVGQPVTMSTKKLAEDVAMLVGAIHITKDRPDLRQKFLEVFRRNNNQILPSVAPTSMAVGDSALAKMRNALFEARGAGLDKQYDDLHPQEDQEYTGRASHRRLSTMEIDFRSKELLQKYDNYLADEKLATLRQTRAQYPMNQHAKEVLEIVQNNLYSIIIGATGSGKTTQVPQILLNEAIQKGEGGKCNIICTQPRRIAAKSIAQRVADERAENLTNSVGYHVRRDAKLPRPGGSVTYCTTGILSMQLQHFPDEVLDSVSHLIIDEVHERDIIIDFLLTTLKKVVVDRLAKGKTTPRITLMSATIDADLFADYFQVMHPQQGLIRCPTLSVPGRTYPVKERHLPEILESIRAKHGPSGLSMVDRDEDTRAYLEAETSFAKANPSRARITSENVESDEQDDIVIDWKSERGRALEKRGMTANEAEEALVPHALVATTIAHIVKTTEDGAILVFLPGLENILEVGTLIRDHRPLGVNFGDDTKFRIFMLHSTIPDAQKDVFDAMPTGCRKIILATNIAETSITIPDVQHVVDTGKLREKQYDQLRRITKLACIWVSKSNVKQRAGRAGRVQNGNYYALYAKERFASLRAVGLPELLRSDLQEVCLDVRAQGFKVPVKQFLEDAIEPPSAEAVETALQNLISLDCLTVQEELTPLGRLLASLPIHPSLGKMIVLGVVFKCLDPLLVIGSLLNERNLFLLPILPDAKKAANASKHAYARETNSDHIAALNAFKEMRYVNETRGSPALLDLSRRKYLHIGAFKSIQGTAETIASILEEQKIINPTRRTQRKDFQIGDPALNTNSDQVGLVKALLLTGVYPNIGKQMRGILYRTPGESNAIIHPSSVNSQQKKLRSRSEEAPSIDLPLVSYSTLAKSSDGRNTYMRDTTEITPLMTCLFGGHISRAENSNRIIRMDDWLPFYVQSRDRKAPNTIMDFRDGLERMQSDVFATLYKRALVQEDPVRNVITKYLVDILDIDIYGEEEEDDDWSAPAESYSKRQDGRDDVRGNLLDSWMPNNRDGSARVDRYAPAGSRLAQHG